MGKLMAHRWPGNARELGNVLQRALVLREGERIEADDLNITPVPVRVEESVSEPVVASAPTPSASSSATLHDVARASKLDRIRSVLDEVNGHRARAARKLGISERNLRYRLADLRALAAAYGNWGMPVIYNKSVMEMNRDLF